MTSRRAEQNHLRPVGGVIGINGLRRRAIDLNLNQLQRGDLAHGLERGDRPVKALRRPDPQIDRQRKLRAGQRQCQKMRKSLGANMACGKGARADNAAILARQRNGLGYVGLRQLAVNPLFRRPPQHFGGKIHRIQWPRMPHLAQAFGQKPGACPHIENRAATPCRQKSRRHMGGQKILHPFGKAAVVALGPSPVMGKASLGAGQGQCAGKVWVCHGAMLADQAP